MSGVHYKQPPENQRDWSRAAPKRYNLSDWQVEIVSKDLVRVGCTDITRAEVEDILAKMRALDPPVENPCWQRLENSSINSSFESAAGECLRVLRSEVRGIRKKFSASGEHSF